MAQADTNLVEILAEHLRESNRIGQWFVRVHNRGCNAMETQGGSAHGPVPEMLSLGLPLVQPDHRAVRHLGVTDMMAVRTRNECPGHRAIAEDTRTDIDDPADGLARVVADCSATDR